MVVQLDRLDCFFEGTVPIALSEQPVVSTTSSEEMISRINRYVAAYLRQR